MLHPNAGKLTKNPINTEQLKNDFYNPSDINPVQFGTSGHRGKLGAGFCHLHAKAIAQAVSRYHRENNITGAVLVGGDTRIMSQETANICAQILAANGHKVILPSHPLPTPVFSYFILNGAAVGSLNGTASHNPPEDMGLKYNPSSGGPAGKEITAVIEKYANYYLKNPKEINLIPIEEAKNLITEIDLVNPYIAGLSKIIDFEAIKKSGLKIAVHPLGGAAIKYFERIKEEFLPNLEILDKTVDPSFKFIPQDFDGRIRMDPSSEYPLTTVLAKKENYDIIGVTDPDCDRFGVITKEDGLIPPNNVLSMMLYYLLSYRKDFPSNLKAARSIATTHLIDCICKDFNRETMETNVGFKYFTQGFLNKELLFAGEESAGMSVYNWVTEKDGILAVLLALEIRAKTQKNLHSFYKDITAKYGVPFYKRLDLPVSDEIKEKLNSITLENLSSVKTIAGEKVISIKIGDGIKLYLEKSWALIRPSGTETKIKLYAESFKSPVQLQNIITESAKIFGLEI